MRQTDVHMVRCVMSKWISDAYIKRLLQNNRLLQGNCEYKLWEQEVKNTVDAMPSIDIVFCKECRWGKPYSDKQLECDALGLGGLKSPDDFCSYGERE